jgi:hypothetical protein
MNDILEEYLEFYDKNIMSLDGIIISSFGDVIIPEKHFGLFPWNELNIRDSNTSTLSAGGYPLKDYQWTICFWLKNENGDTHPCLYQYRWCIPAQLLDLMNWCKDFERNDLQNKLKSLLGVRA